MPGRGHVDPGAVGPAASRHHARPGAADAAHRPLDLLQCLGPSHRAERTAALARRDTEILNIVL